MTDDNDHQNRTQLSRSRWLLRAVCIVATFYSAPSAAFAVILTVQFLNDEIPAGKVEAITGQTKMGTRLRLDNGSEVVFSKQVPVQIALGDSVEKRRESAVYFVNGKALTDTSWLLYNWLLPPDLLVPLGVYLLAGAAYVLMYRRTPYGDLVWADADRSLPSRPRTLFGMIAAMFLFWLLVTVSLTTVFGCVDTVLAGIGKAVLR